MLAHHLPLARPIPGRVPPSSWSAHSPIVVLAPSRPYRCYLAAFQGMWASRGTPSPTSGLPPTPVTTWGARTPALLLSLPPPLDPGLARERLHLLPPPALRAASPWLLAVSASEGAVLTPWGVSALLSPSPLSLSPPSRAALYPSELAHMGVLFLLLTCTCVLVGARGGRPRQWS